MSISPEELPPATVSRPAIAGRLRLVRTERFGEGGVAALAEQLGVPPETWSNYERGVSIPGDVLLIFLLETGVEPLWLLRGGGPRYRPAP